MSKPEIILIGAGGHSNSCIDVIESEDKYKIAGLIGLDEELGKRQLGYEVIGTDADLPYFSSQFDNAIVTVGQIKSPEIRIRLYKLLKNTNFILPMIVSPTAHISRHSIIGEGTIVMHQAIVNAGSKIGKNCIINNKALIEHDAEIRDHCHISTSAVINGGSIINEKTFIGSNAMISNNLEIDSSQVISGGANILKSIKR